MARYCTKCGKELIKDRVIGFDPKTGDPVAEYSCPVYLKDCKTVRQREKGINERVEEIFNSPENQISWIKAFFSNSGSRVKETRTDIKLRLERECYKGTGFIETFLAYFHEHDNRIKLVTKKNSPDEKSEEEEVI